MKHIPNQVWVSPDGSGWKVKSAGAEKAFRHTNTKIQAVQLANNVAQNKHAELLVQNKDGQIGYKSSHGHDPYPPRG